MVPCKWSPCTGGTSECANPGPPSNCSNTWNESSRAPRTENRAYGTARTTARCCFESARARITPTVANPDRLRVPVLLLFLQRVSQVQPAAQPTPGQTGPGETPRVVQTPPAAGRTHPPGRSRGGGKVGVRVAEGKGPRSRAARQGGEPRSVYPAGSPEHLHRRADGSHASPLQGRSSGEF